MHYVSVFGWTDCINDFPNQNEENKFYQQPQKTVSDETPACAGKLYTMWVTVLTRKPLWENTAVNGLFTLC